jgi:hypothetical protein
MHPAHPLLGCSSKFVFKNLKKMINKQTGYNKNVFLTKSDYLPFTNWKAQKQRRNAIILGFVVSFAIIAMFVWYLSF